MSFGVLNEKEVSDVWKAMPLAPCCNGWAEDGKSHIRSAANMVDTKAGEHAFNHKIQLWEENPPYVMKLQKGVGLADNLTFAYIALQMAKKFRTKPVHWSFEYTDEANKTLQAQSHMNVYRPSTCSHFGRGSENMTAYVGRNWSNVLILDRCSFCSRFPANVTCRPELDRRAPLRDSWIGWSQQVSGEKTTYVNSV
eukprot:gene7707-875_t